jgi:hypothetical protein
MTLPLPPDIAIAIAIAITISLSHSHVIAIPMAIDYVKGQPSLLGNSITYCSEP